MKMKTIETMTFEGSYFYNTSPELFRAASLFYAERGITLSIADGHIIAGLEDPVARFADNQAASLCLIEAGYLRDTPPSDVFHPPGSSGYFEMKYGIDFLKKLPLYTTAYYRGRPVRLLSWHAEVGSFIVIDADRHAFQAPLRELDSFVL